MILDRITAATRERVAGQKRQVSLKTIGNQAFSMNQETGFPFATALRLPEMSFICEIKKASPSRGLIVADFPYLDIAREYELAGADAISVLTEPDFFLGSDVYLQDIHSAVNIPVLRKDFIIDPYQVFEAKVLGASAVLLICALLDTVALKDYLAICGQLGLSALVEAHDAGEIESALQAGASIIGINNRNLKDFSVDLDNCVRLRQLVPEGVVAVAESGIKTREDIEKLEQAGIDAVLIGEFLMQSPDKRKALQELRGN
jgi:indole-3-glycerol phosphate synthase